MALKYVKPVLEVVQLRPDEGLACGPSRGGTPSGGYTPPTPAPKKKKKKKKK